MWVLSTDRAELHFFASPEDIKDGYAALSHTWKPDDEDGPPEQSFKKVQEIQKRCAQARTNPRNSVSKKIKRCCELAEKHGYKWVWIDTCCIDKTSSAELSEAINSMFRYYALATICYGYLRDVDTVLFSREEFEKDIDSQAKRYKQFLRSIWFQRGWTLQELIAPRLFVFLSSSWKIIGTKADLAELLEYHFHIPAAVLRLQISHTEFSIAQRMSWFQWRRTTRPEDEAYCLLGLFDIHMPPLYGEGRNAFRRLQEEIMKQSADTTLFAWTQQSPSSWGCLFAVSPGAFEVHKRNDGIVYTPPRRTADTSHNDSALEARADMNDMTFAVTPTGVRANIPIFQREGKTFADLYWSLGNGSGRRVVLLLELDPDSQASSSHRLSYQVGYPRLEIDSDIDVDGPPSWKEVLIRHRPPLRRLPGQLPDSSTFDFTPAIPMQLSFDAPVRFPEARIQQFLMKSDSNHFEIRGAGLDSPWRADSSVPTAYIFTGQFFIILKVGQCQQEGPFGEQGGRPRAIWATCTVRAKIVAAEEEEDFFGRSVSDAVDTGLAPRKPPENIEWETEISKFSTDTNHDCSQDHVLQWPDLRKTFGFEPCTPGTVLEVTLSFKPCPLNPGRTLILEASHRLPWDPAA